MRTTYHVNIDFREIRLRSVSKKKIDKKEKEKKKEERETIIKISMRRLIKYICTKK